MISLKKLINMFHKTTPNRHHPIPEGQQKQKQLAETRHVSDTLSRGNAVRRHPDAWTTPCRSLSRFGEHQDTSARFLCRSSPLK